MCSPGLDPGPEKNNYFSLAVKDNMRHLVTFESYVDNIYECLNIDFLILIIVLWVWSRMKVFVGNTHS